MFHAAIDVNIALNGDKHIYRSRSRNVQFHTKREATNMQLKRN